ncbi:MAG TPA: CoA ester lyase [Rhizobium sp.]|nr:CoA ester lyase [Rhizobium sp.]
MSLSSSASLSVRLRRSVLSVPAINSRALAKVPDLDCDVVIFDLEDSVAPEKKGEARENLRRFFAEVSPLHDKECVIRINGHDTGFADDDMAAVIACRPDAVLLPKVDGPQDVERVADLLAETDAPEGLRIWAMMETPLGVLNAAAIARMGRTDGARLDCLVIGLNDLRKATGVPAGSGRTFLVPWLMQVVLAARAFGLDVIDSVSNDFSDIAAFEAECRQGRSMGFDGKMLIHPAQIGPANRYFGPSAEEIAEAQAIAEVFATPAAAELNVVNSNGRMIERLHLGQAERLLAKAKIIQDRKGNST